MIYETTVRCPVCRDIFDVIEHDEPELNGQATAMLLGDCRREHARHSPDCTRDLDNWIRGWDTTTRQKPTLAETLAAGLLPEDQIPGHAL